MLTRNNERFDVEPTMPTAARVDWTRLRTLARLIWKSAAVGSLLCASLAGVYLCVATSKYTAQVSLLLDTQTNQFLKKQSIMADPIVDTGVMDSQVEVLTSESIALDVIRKLNLTKDREFVGPPKDLIGKTVQGLLGLVASAEASLGFAAHDSSEDTPERRALEKFAKGLSVKRVGVSYVMDLSFTSENAEKSAKIANAVAQAYVDEEIAASFAATSRAEKWLRSRLDDIRSMATTADREVQVYKQQHGIVDTGKGLMNQQQIADLNSQLIVAKNATAEARARLDRIRHLDGNQMLDATVSDALSNAVITRLRAQYLDLQAHADDLGHRLGQRHQTVTKLRNQMKDIKAAIANEVQRISDAYASDYAISQARENSLRTSLASLVDLSGSTDLAQVKLRELQSSAESFRQLYDDFLQKAQETMQQTSSPMSATRVITAATVPLHRSSPKILLVLAGALLVGAAVGGAVGYLRESDTERLASPDSVAAVVGAPCLGVLPKLDIRGPRGLLRRLGRGDLAIDQASLEYAMNTPFSRFAETLRNVKMTIDKGADAGESRTIAITSSLPKEGKTTVAMNLASLVASYGIPTLLIDADFHRRGLTRACAAEATDGIIEAMAEPSRLSDLVTSRPDSGLDILPCAQKARPTNSADLLGSRQMHDLLAAARKRYTYVFIDLPPIGPVVDGESAAAIVDHVLFVVGWGKATRRVVHEALASAELVSQKVVGAIISQADPATLKVLEGYRPKQFEAYYVG